MVIFRGRTYGCHLELTIELIGGKWEGLLLWNIGNKGVVRFGELSRLHPGLTTRMLAQQLRELEAGGLVLRKAYPVTTPKVEYRLTPSSLCLMPPPRRDGRLGQALYRRRARGGRTSWGMTGEAYRRL